MKSKAFTEEELNMVSKDFLVKMYLQLADSFQQVNRQLDAVQTQNAVLVKKIDALQENLAVLTQQRFGRKTEKFPVNPDQYGIDLGDVPVLNEAEAITEDGLPEEPDMETVIVKRRKKKGKREADLKNLESLPPEYHELSETRLAELFPKGYSRLEDDVYRELEYIPARCLVHEHHVAVYAGNNKEGIIRADRPERLLKNSILTPSLAAAVFNAKYVNALPLNRFSEELARNEINISKQVLAGCMIKIPDRFLRPVIKEMWRELKKSHLIHCDETPFKVTADKKDRSYMWVYHAADQQGARPVFIYEYNEKRNTDVLRASLHDYTGVLMTDGYQVYHTFDREKGNDLKVAGCWIHARRKFAEIAKSLDSKTPNSEIAEEAIRRIQAIYHVDNMFKNSSAEERLEHRKTSVKPLVDAYFAWINDPAMTFGMDHSSNTYKAIQYSRNQEPFLRAFLTDPAIPLDNNDAERSIRSFCVGKHNWHIADTKAGAETSGMLYSIAETAKANNLKPYEYFKYLLEQILNHLDDDPSSYIPELLPWSDSIPDSCRKLNM